MEHWEILVSLVVGVLTLAGWVTGVFKRLIRAVRRLGHPQQVASAPTRTIIAQPRVSASWWHMGKAGESPAMQIVAQFDVTNITDYNAILTSARLKRPKATGRVSVPDPNSNYWGEYFIPPRAVSQAHADFWVVPPTKEKGKELTATVGLVDQFGNVHWVKKVRFKYS